ncbi:AtpZ/AtpI family protein [Pseudomonas sp. NW5]|uniref:AtpZ/AtpI family protein n=1 Tax=Pseudomonas sp. NW5 TaxID=2934934 RepID=UPI002020AC24|nr:AtpZ/AtpI family protein [Pseudomonas sp. NW5]MCL7461385.1 AtpZ/AtpI family protein [Pseudomonas sp. NW5]
MKPDEQPDRHLDDAARRAVARETQARDDPEPSLGRRLGQVGVLGWVIVGPLLLGLFVGRELDRWLDTGVTFSAALLCVGVGVGLWAAWRWVQRQ